jgi:hypothetical protein
LYCSPDAPSLIAKGHLCHCGCKSYLVNRRGPEV